MTSGLWRGDVLGADAPRRVARGVRRRKLHSCEARGRPKDLCPFRFSARLLAFAQRRDVDYCTVVLGSHDDYVNSMAPYAFD